MSDCTKSKCLKGRLKIFCSYILSSGGEVLGNINSVWFNSFSTLVENRYFLIIQINILTSTQPCSYTQTSLAVLSSHCPSPCSPWELGFLSSLENWDFIALQCIKCPRRCKRLCQSLGLRYISEAFE